MPAIRSRPAIRYLPPSVTGMSSEASSEAPTAWSADSAAESALATASRDTLIVLKGEAIYAATDYWIEGGQLFCVLRSGGEGAFDLNKVDWEKTARLNAERGIIFNLRVRPRVH